MMLCQPTHIIIIDIIGDMITHIIIPIIEIDIIIRTTITIIVHHHQDQIHHPDITDPVNNS